MAGLLLAFVGAVLVALSQLGPLEALWSVNFLRIPESDKRIERVVKFAERGRGFREPFRESILSWTLSPDVTVECAA